jgi:hypothetical protein
VAERFRWRAIYHFAFGIETGIMTGADETPGVLVPVDGARKMRATTGQDKDVVGCF